MWNKQNAFPITIIFFIDIYISYIITKLIDGFALSHLKLYINKL